MKHMKTQLGIAAALIIAPAVMAVPIQVLVDDTPRQDVLNGGTHEIGVNFPTNELISSELVPWGGHIPCPVDYQDGGAVQVRITNLSSNNWANLVYVADPETSLSNDDGMIADATVPNTYALAFNIDNFGANTPLVFESMTQDNVFEVGETWEFVIQEYSSTLGLAPELLDSWDNVNRGQVAGASAGGPPSSGSIIAIPEPATFGLLAAFGGGLLWFRRHFKI